MNRRKIGIVTISCAALALALVLWARSGGDRVQIALPIDPEAGVGPAEFSVATYNVQARPWFDDAAEKLPQIAPKLGAFDIACVQECFQRSHLLLDQAPFKNFAYFGGLMKPWKLANSGLATLTNLPMGEATMAHYRAHGEFQNRVASKGILLTRLQVGGLPLDVYNTHMEAGDRSEAQTARHAQAREVIAFVQQHSPPDRALILTGDFNMSPTRPGKVFDPNRRGHYSTEEDMKSRNAAFDTLQEGLGLRDAHDTLLGPVSDDIERFLFRDGAAARLVPLEIRSDPSFTRSDGSALSDGAPHVARFRIIPQNEGP